MFTATYRTLAIRISLLALLAFAGNTNAFAQPGTPQASVPPFTLNFDETGASLLNGGPNPNPVVPVAGGGIQFYLPGLVTPGDVLISTGFDVNSANPTGASDVLSFSNGPGLTGTLTGIMLYQSLLEPADPLLAADVQNLVFATPFSPLQETGTEAANGFSWITTGATYNGLSDGFLRTPEPSTFVLGGLGLLSLAAMAYWRRRTRSH